MAHRVLCGGWALCTQLFFSVLCLWSSQIPFKIKNYSLFPWIHSHLYVTAREDVPSPKTPINELATRYISGLKLATMNCTEASCAVKRRNSAIFSQQVNFINANNSEQLTAAVLMASRLASISSKTKKGDLHNKSWSKMDTVVHNRKHVLTWIVFARTATVQVLKSMLRASNKEMHRATHTQGLAGLHWVEKQTSIQIDQASPSKTPLLRPTIQRTVS